MALGQVFVPEGGGGGGGGSLDVYDEGVLETTAADKLNFTGAGVTATDDGTGGTDIDIPGAGAALYTAWDPFVPDASPASQTDEFTSNTAANYTLIYTGDAGVVTDIDSTARGALYIEATSNNYHSKGYVKALPAGDFTLHTHIILSGDMNASAVAAGLVLSTGNTAGAGSHTIYGIGYESAINRAYAWSWNQWGNTATGNTNSKINYNAIRAFVRLRRVSTTYTQGWSLDGRTWHEQAFAPCFGSAPAYMGLALVNYSGGVARASFDFFRYYATGTQYTTGALRTVYG